MTIEHELDEEPAASGGGGTPTGELGPDPTAPEPFPDVYLDQVPLGSVLDEVPTDYFETFQIPDLPVNRQYAAATWHDGHLYLIGKTEYGNYIEPLRYEPENGKWHSLPRLNISTGGGEAWSDPTNDAVLFHSYSDGNIHEYDVISNTWSVRHSSGSLSEGWPALSGGGVQIDGTTYANHTSSNYDLWVYNPADSSETVVSTGVPVWDDRTECWSTYDEVNERIISYAMDTNSFIAIHPDTGASYPLPISLPRGIRTIGDGNSYFNIVASEGYLYILSGWYCSAQYAYDMDRRVWTYLNEPQSTSGYYRQVAEYGGLASILAGADEGGDAGPQVTTMLLDRSYKGVSEAPDYDAQLISIPYYSDDPTFGSWYDTSNATQFGKSFVEDSGTTAYWEPVESTGCLYEPGVGDTLEISVTTALPFEFHVGASDTTPTDGYSVEIDPVAGTLALNQKTGGTPSELASTSFDVAGTFDVFDSLGVDDTFPYVELDVQSGTLTATAYDTTGTAVDSVTYTGAISFPGRQWGFTTTGSGTYRFDGAVATTVASERPKETLPVTDTFDASSTAYLKGGYSSPSVSLGNMTLPVSDRNGGATFALWELESPGTSVSYAFDYTEPGTFSQDYYVTVTCLDDDGLLSHEVWTVGPTGDLTGTGTASGDTATAGGRDAVGDVTVVLGSGWADWDSETMTISEMRLS